MKKQILWSLLFSVLINYSQCLDRTKDCRCKISNDQPNDFLSLIVGGREAKPLSYPWMVRFDFHDSVSY